MHDHVNSIKRFCRPLLVVAVVLAAWLVASALEWVNPLFLPRPISVGRAFVAMLGTSDLYTAVWATAYRAFLGLMLSVVVAVPLGLLFGRLPRLYAFFELPVDFFRSIPSSALFFFFVLVFGIGDASKVAIVFYGCSLVLLVNTIYGAKSTKPKLDRINMLRSFGATNWQVFHLAVFRDAMPHVMAGLRVCISLALVLVIVSEMFLGSTIGLGRQLYDLYLNYRVPEMYASLIMLGLLGFGANGAFGVIERRLCFWLGNER